MVSVLLVMRFLIHHHRLTSNSTSNSYLRSSWMYQHLPNHRVPSLFDSSRNQSMSAALLFSTYFHNDHIQKIHSLISQHWDMKVNNKEYTVLHFYVNKSVLNLKFYTLWDSLYIVHAKVKIVPKGDWGHLLTLTLTSDDLESHIVMNVSSISNIIQSFDNIGRSRSFGKVWSHVTRQLGGNSKIQPERF